MAGLPPKQLYSFARLIFPRIKGLIESQSRYFSFPEGRRSIEAQIMNFQRKNSRKLFLHFANANNQFTSLNENEQLQILKVLVNRLKSILEPNGMKLVEYDQRFYTTFESSDGKMTLTISYAETPYTLYLKYN